MVPGDMPGFDGTLTTMLNNFNNLPPEVAVKHTIVISDGDPIGPTAQRAQGFKKAKIKITTRWHRQARAGRTHENAAIANFTGGKFYEPKSANALAANLSERSPRRCAAADFRDAKPASQPQETFPHEMLKGIGDDCRRSPATC